MVVRYLIDAAGIEAGTEKFLPDTLALELVEMGVCENAEKPKNTAPKVEVAESVAPAKKSKKSSRK